jgi:hypothetical protein
VVAVRDDESEGRPERSPVPKPREHLHPVLLELLARTSSVSLLAPRKVGVDPIPLEDEASGQAGQNRDEPGAVRLPRSRELEGHDDKPTTLVSIFNRVDRSFQTDAGQSPAS